MIQQIAETGVIGSGSAYNSTLTITPYVVAYGAHAAHSLTITWGDGRATTETRSLEQPVAHTYSRPGRLERLGSFAMNVTFASTENNAGQDTTLACTGFNNLFIGPGGVELNPY